MAESLRIEYIDKNFSIEQSEDCILLIEFNLSQNLLAIVKESKLKLLLRWNDEDIDEQLFTLINLPFKERHASLLPTAFTLVPALEKKDNTQSTYLNLFGLSNHWFTLLKHDLVRSDISMVYAVNKALYAGFVNRFKLKNLKAINVALLNGIDKLKNQQNVLSINFTNHKTITFTYYQAEHLRFHNTFQTTHINDFTYYLLSIAKQWKINLNAVDVVVSGQVNNSSGYLGKLKEYCPSISKAEIDHLINSDGDLVLTNRHEYFTLFNLLCEL